MTTGEVLAEQMRVTRGWTLELIADLDGDDWTFQPRPGLQHALWLCGHLACAQELLIFRRTLDRKVLDDDFLRHFAPGGAIKSATEYDWPSPQLVRRKLDEVQAAADQTLRTLNDAVLAEPAYGRDGARHPYYDTKMGAFSHAARHEAFHAGQLAMIRRLLNKPFLR